MCKIIICVMLLLSLIQKVKCPVPGTFFWKPRLGLEFSLSTEGAIMRTGDAKPSKANIQSGTAVLIDGYKTGVTILALAVNIEASRSFSHLNPLSAYYFTNAYRWFLRHASLITKWISGSNKYKVVDTHKVWRKRFSYTDSFVPHWVRPLFVWIPQDEWKTEEKEHRHFKINAEHTFNKYNRYPSKKFNDWKSWTSTDSEDSKVSNDSPSA